jgi:tetratricopeptide (TPR) repeat protein
MYPRDPQAHNALSMTYASLGQYEKALPAAREVLRLDPTRGLSYSNVAIVYLRLNRLEEARATLEEAENKKLSYPVLHRRHYVLAFLQDDAEGMARQVAWSENNPGVDNILLGYVSNAAAYSGHLEKARALSNRAVAAAEPAEQTENAAIHEANAAVQEALFGNTAQARQRAAFQLSKGRDILYAATLALVIAGDESSLRATAGELHDRYLDDTLAQFNYLPVLRARSAIRHDNPAKAIELLQTSGPYELSDMGACTLYPAFVRGEAYLAAHQPKQAAAEFQKIIDHRGVVVTELIGSLAHLQLARALSSSGDYSAAKSAYQTCLILWKDADPDLAVLKQAKSEYAELR